MPTRRDFIEECAKHKDAPNREAVKHALAFLHGDPAKPYPSIKLVIELAYAMQRYHQERIHNEWGTTAPGWYDHNGVRRPVDENLLVRVRFRDKSEQEGTAGAFRWTWKFKPQQIQSSNEYLSDIVAYRLIH